MDLSSFGTFKKKLAAIYVKVLVNMIFESFFNQTSHVINVLPANYFLITFTEC